VRRRPSCPLAVAEGGGGSGGAHTGAAAKDENIEKRAVQGCDGQMESVCVCCLRGGVMMREAVGKSPFVFPLCFHVCVCVFGSLDMTTRHTLMTCNF
jgi:hypothetical protein